MTKVIIIGAGMAGLAAALALKARGISYVILEAAGHPGGRAVTVTTATGTPVDLGAHWLHGEDTPLRPLIDSYGIGYRADEESGMLICENGTTRHADSEDWLDSVVDQGKADGIKAGTLPDCPLPDLGKDARARRMLTVFGQLWNGVEPPLEPSALEFLTDENTPGGLQPDGGMGAVIAAMAGDAGDIRYDTVVTGVGADADGVVVHSTAETWHADYVLVTVSLGVLKSGAIAFDPPLGSAMADYLGGITMGTMNKIIAEVHPGFFHARNIPVDFALELLDGDPPHFCHLHSAGQPVITLFVCGKHAAEVEAMDDAAALAYLIRVLAPVEQLKGFEKHMVGAPTRSGWVGNPFTRGAYSACLPGGKRTGPRFEGRIGFCGDTFDTRFPASLAGAFRSGQAAAEEIARLTAF